MPAQRHGDQLPHVTKASAKALARAVASAEAVNANDDKRTLELKACQGLLTAHEEMFANNTRHTQYLERQVRSMQEKEAKSKVFVKGFIDNAMNAPTREQMCRSLFESLGAEARDIVDVNPWQWNGFLGKECLVQFRNGPVKEYWLSQFYRKFGRDGVWNDEHQIKVFVQPFEAQTRLDKLKVWRTVLSVVGSYCEAQGDPDGLQDFAKIWSFPQKLIYGEDKDGKQSCAVVVDWDDRPGTCIVYSDEIHYELLCKEFPVAFFEKFCNKKQWDEYYEAEQNEDGQTMPNLEDAVMNRFPWPIHFVKTTFEGSVHEFRKSKSEKEEGKGKGGGKSDKSGGKGKGKSKEKGKGRKGGGGKGKGKSQSKEDAWGADWFNEETEDEKKRREAHQQAVRGAGLPKPAAVPEASKKEQEEEPPEDAWGKYSGGGGSRSRNNWNDQPYSKPWSKDQSWSKHSQYEDHGHEGHGGQSSDARSSRSSYKR